MAGTPSPGGVSTKLQRIAGLARTARDKAFTALAHHIDIELLREAYRRTRKDGAVGVDGQTAEEYAAHLEEHLQGLLERFKSGTYQAPPVRRVHIPKGDGTKTRPIGVPTFEDKVLQRAVAMVLAAVYEQDVLDCSYGFRPGRSAHQALETRQQGVTWMAGGVVIDLDIKAFFDTLNHRVLRGFLDQRVRDGVLRRAIDKWLNAGVLEQGAITCPEMGTPQGGVVSPILANIYLHEVLDRWFEETVKPRLSGKAFLVRYADDAIIVCSSERDARRVMEVLPKRFGKYGLTLHPDKTRLVQFRRPSGGPGCAKVRRDCRPESFDLLGFTHYWALSRKGKWVVKRKTASSRFTRATRAIHEWCRQHRHWPVAWQQEALALKLRGHFGYYGITGNSRALVSFRHEVIQTWRKWLDRRSQRRRMPWKRFTRLLEQYGLPPPIAVHSQFRQAANTVMRGAGCGSSARPDLRGEC